MHVHLRQHLHALQHNPLSVLATCALLVWLSESMGVDIAGLTNSFDRPASAAAANFDCAAWFARLWYWCQCNTKLLILHCMHDCSRTAGTCCIHNNAVQIRSTCLLTDHVYMYGSGVWKAHSIVVTALILAFMLHWRSCCCGCVATVRLEGRR